MALNAAGTRRTRSAQSTARLGVRMLPLYMSGMEGHTITYCLAGAAIISKRLIRGERFCGSVSARTYLGTLCCRIACTSLMPAVEMHFGWRHRRIWRKTIPGSGNAKIRLFLGGEVLDSWMAVVLVVFDSLVRSPNQRSTSASRGAHPEFGCWVGARPSLIQPFGTFSPLNTDPVDRVWSSHGALSGRGSIGGRDACNAASIQIYGMAIF